MEKWFILLVLGESYSTITRDSCVKGVASCSVDFVVVYKKSIQQSNHFLAFFPDQPLVGLFMGVEISHLHLALTAI